MLTFQSFNCPVPLMSFLLGILFLFWALWLSFNLFLSAIIVWYKCCKTHTTSWLARWTWLASGYNIAATVSKHCNVCSSSRIVEQNAWSKANSSQPALDQEKLRMLGENNATWAAKRSNSVGPSKVWTLDATLLDSLAKAWHVLLPLIACFYEESLALSKLTLKNLKVKLMYRTTGCD